ncbi:MULTISPECIES: 3D domain-containing protein [Paenibacillus]|uniref:3D domain-containing protein n=1 Tax=Paenibacillus TaxID=44249 RepID=UPI00387397A1
MILNGISARSHAIRIIFGTYPSILLSAWNVLRSVHLTGLSFARETDAAAQSKTFEYEASPAAPVAEPYVVTAYALRGTTASGNPVRAGVTVACPKELPFGTRLLIEGVGERVCTDRGGAIHGHRLDLYVTSARQVRQFGRQTLDVTILIFIRLLLPDLQVGVVPT